jgi:hypothetical protein
MSCLLTKLSEYELASDRTFGSPTIPNLMTFAYTCSTPLELVAKRLMPKAKAKGNQNSALKKCAIIGTEMSANLKVWNANTNMSAKSVEGSIRLMNVRSQRREELEPCTKLDILVVYCGTMRMTC